MLKTSIILGSAAAVVAVICAEGTTADMKCTDPAVLDTSKTCTGAACAAVDFGTTDAMCCMAAPAVMATCAEGTATDMKCATDTVLDTSQKCAAAACAAGDFGDKTKACCKDAAVVTPAAGMATCAEGTATDMKCATGTVLDTSQKCAAAACAAGDFGDKTKVCCMEPEVPNTGAVCAASTTDDALKCTATQDVATDKKCVADPCVAKDFGEEGRCCKAKAPVMAACKEGDTADMKCKSPAVFDKSKKCAGAACAAADFGDKTKMCCMEAPKDSGAASLLPNFVLAAVGLMAWY